MIRFENWLSTNEPPRNAEFLKKLELITVRFDDKVTVIAPAEDALKSIKDVLLFKINYLKIESCWC